MNVLLFCLKGFFLFPIDKVKPIDLSKLYQPHLHIRAIFSTGTGTVH